MIKHPSFAAFFLPNMNIMLIATKKWLAGNEYRG